MGVGVLGREVGVGVMKSESCEEEMRGVCVEGKRQERTKERGSERRGEEEDKETRANEKIKMKKVKTQKTNNIR